MSRVLNNSESISERSKQKVLKAIEELNYQPSKIARGLSSGFDALLVVSRSTKTTKNNPFFSEVLHVISRFAEDENYDVILQTSQNSEEEIQKCITKTTNKLIRGIIMLSAPTDEEVFKKLDLYGIPIAVIGKVEGNYEHIYSIDTNNYQDSYNLIQHLINIGHEEIACLYSPQEYHVSVDRLEGYRQCMLDNNLPLKEEWMVNCGFTMEEAYEKTKVLFENKTQIPSAIFATDDLKLLGLYKALKEYKIGVPDQVVVGGYSNTELTSFLLPSIIQIKNPTFQLGEAAIKILFSIIKDKKTMVKQTIISTEKIIRD